MHSLKHLLLLQSIVVDKMRMVLVTSDTGLCTVHWKLRAYGVPGRVRFDLDGRISWYC